MKQTVHDFVDNFFRKIAVCIKNLYFCSVIKTDSVMGKSVNMETKNVSPKTAKKTQKQWGVDEYVNWDEYQHFCNFGCDSIMMDKAVAEKKCIKEECLRHLCSRELKKNCKTLRHRVINGQGAWFFNDNAEGKEVKVGNICFKALRSACDKKYGKEEKQESAGH